MNYLKFLITLPDNRVLEYHKVIQVQLDFINNLYRITLGSFYDEQSCRSTMRPEAQQKVSISMASVTVENIFSESLVLCGDSLGWAYELVDDSIPV